jgi:ornithine decarboxylase
MPPTPTARQRAFIDEPGPTPVVVLDLDVVARRYDELVAALPGVEVFYAMKANPAPEILRVLDDRGASFDVASGGEIATCLGLGVEGRRLSFGNTIKRRSAISSAVAAGVEIFSFDSSNELEKQLAVAPGSVAMCRVLCDGSGAAWPLSRKFGTSDGLAVDLLLHAAAAGARPAVTFHVGSQQLDPLAWDKALARVADMADALDTAGHRLELVNLGGGFPSDYEHDAEDMATFGGTVMEAVQRRIGGLDVRLICEPGRFLVAEAGVLVSEVVLTSTRFEEFPERWVYLDVGVFTGLIETIDETIRYPYLTSRDGGPTVPSVVAGPTCDSLDVMTPRVPVDLPAELTEGDTVALLGAGAYTTSYSSIGFNGFPPLRQVVLPLSNP